ncbi:MAG: thiolase domain-containing protein [Microgenomates group bacterium]
MNITVAGIGMTKFGELWAASPRWLASVAVAAAIKDSGIEKKSIQGLFVANMLSGMLGMQGHLGALLAEELGLSGIPAYTVEGACASGGLAVHAGIMSILSGQYDTVCVLGVEKMTDHKPELVSSALMGAGSNEERLAGATFPGLYAILARSHMEKYGTTEQQLASVAVKNHFHASLNALAQFTHPITVEQVMKSSCVADPLKLLDCSPVTDGAAAIILTKHQSKKSGVYIIASAVATDTLGLAGRKNLTELQATKQAAFQAFTQAGVGQKDIHLAEVHDCFTIAEILAIEDMGFEKKGDVGMRMEKGAYTLGTAEHIVINSSGGLKGCGHPIGATGVKQIVEITNQLRGVCGKRQVKNARLGLAHNVGGSGATAVVHILKK